MKSVLVWIMLVSLPGVFCSAGDADVPVSPNKEVYLRLAGEMESNLQKEILDRWFPAAVDEAGGGFHENFSVDWTRQPGSDKSIVYQSRLTWTAAQAVRRFPERSEFYLAMTRRGTACLADRLWDRERGGFYWSVGADGRPNREGVAHKQVYGVAFGLYALAASYEVTRDAASLELAQRCFRWMEQFAHDSEQGGYLEFVTLDGSRVQGGVANPIGAKGDQKSMNTHIHVLEALTQLYRVWPDAAVRTRVEEVFNLCLEKIYAEPGFLTQFLSADWKRLPGPDSFGHDVEAGFLLIEAAEALGRPDDERAWKAARRLVDHALACGWDQTHGGLYDAGMLDDQGHLAGGLVTEKIWWVQAENLNALLLQHEPAGRETSDYWNAFVRQWNFIAQHQVDRERGGWYRTVGANGAPDRPVQQLAKSDRWTECYHQARAMLVVSDRLRKMAQEAK